MLKLTDPDGAVGWGEIAPIPWMGSETLEQAFQFCQQYAAQGTGELPEGAIAQIPDALPACQFGVESAVWEFQHFRTDPTTLSFWGGVGNAKHSQQSSNCILPMSILLPSGEAVLTQWQPHWATGARTFKWKIGVAAIASELAWFHQWIADLPPTAKIRLDANGGLDWEAAIQWLEVCDRLNQTPATPQIEFVEQPLPPDQWENLFHLSQRFATPIALDESVTTVAQMQAWYERGWCGLFVVKPAIAGFPSQVQRFCQQPDVQVVWSSALETTIARRFILHRLIPSLPPNPYALGFGVTQWLDDDFSDPPDVEQLWQNL